MLIIDECQEAFSDPELAAEFEFKVSRIAKRGPALGIILLLATQRPDAKSLPPAIASNMGVRFCLRVLGWRENNMVLGDGMSASRVQRGELRRVRQGDRLSRRSRR